MRKLVVSLFIFCLAACGTSPNSKFYQIRSADIVVGKVLSNKKILVGIDSVQIPQYLDRPQIVTDKKNSAELDVSEFNRWIEPLSPSITRAVADDISLYLPNATVQPDAFIVETFNYTVSIQVNRIDINLGNSMLFDAWWSVSKNGNVVKRQRFKQDIKIGESYDNMVENLSVLIGEMSKQIAVAIATK